MKITIDVSEFWLEEDNIASGLKSQITQEAITQIKTSIKEKIDTTIFTEIKSHIQLMLEPVIKEHVISILASGEITPRGIGSKPISIENYVKDMFNTSFTYNSTVQDLVKKIGNQFGEEMKKRYDFQFAANIVSKMEENGMLRPNIAKLLDK